MASDSRPSKPSCHRCGRRNERVDGEIAVQLQRVKAANGAFHVCWFCTCCQRSAERQTKWLPRATVDAILAEFGKDFDDIPIFRDNSVDAPACIICGEPGTEYHHWMPQCLQEHPAVAADLAAWEVQGAYLCVKHHRIWHDLVTPWMRPPLGLDGEKPEAYSASE